MSICKFLPDSISSVKPNAVNSPTNSGDELRRKAVSEWLPSSGYELRDAPEIGMIHWFREKGNDKVNNSRYCEL